MADASDAFQRGCYGRTFCQQGVGPNVLLKGYPGKGFGVVAIVPLRKGQYVCTYSAEILDFGVATARESA